MRKIKFRQWLEEPDYSDMPSRMVEPNFQGEINKVFDLNGKQLRYQGTSYYMQYIGIDDSKGKEIYEGDIVKVTVDSDNYIAEVKYYGNSDYPAFDIEPPESYYYDSNVISKAKADEIIEVIGNIYENPELLEDCE